MATLNTYDTKRAASAKQEEEETDTLTLRVWDDGYSETWDVTEDDDYAALAEDEWSKGDWGDGDYRIKYWWEVTNQHGHVIDSGDGEIEHASAEPDCPKADEHNWTSEHEGGVLENPGVWSLGGTRMRFTSHCRLCGMRREEITTGSQYNPGECDTTTYSEPDSEWVAEHYGDEA